jgi:hypothetical protein
VTTPADPQPDVHSKRTDWRSIFPDVDHRWVMGLRRGDVAEFFAGRDPTGGVCAERRRWLEEDPQRYAALPAAAEPALAETVALARSLGLTIDTSLTPWHQLLALGRGWESDFVWMQADGAGAHRVAGGVVCFPSSWALRDKLGLTMSQTHHPVPGLNAVMERQIETFFARMSPGVAWVRENANYSRVPDLNLHPDRPRPRLDASVKLDEVWIRLEHQILLKLQVSRCILFAIRIEITPLRRVLADPVAVAGLARLLKTLPAAAAEYKGVNAARDVIIHLLRSVEPGPAADRGDM